MRYLKAVMHLIRWPNLCIVFLAQYLFYYCLIIPYQIAFSKETFYLLCGAAVLSAAAGNVINDYFDVEIDKINKPTKVIIGTLVSSRFGIFLYALLNILALGLAVEASRSMGDFFIFYFVTACIVLLWLYSKYWKKVFLIGNITVAALTAGPMVLLSIVEFRIYGIGFSFLLQCLYIFFSFWTCLIREIVKDCEDVDGDRRLKANTLPIVWSIATAKRTSVLMTVFLAIVFLLLLGSIISFRLWILGFILVILIIMSYLLISKITRSEASKDFHKASSLLKWIMLVGILSMILVSHYIRIF